MESKSKPYKKIAIVHDVLIEYGGAEVVLSELLKMFPKADLYTFLYNSKNEQISAVFPVPVKKSLFFSRTIFFVLGKYISVLKFFSWIYFYLLNLKEYDLIISSSHSYNSKIVHKKSGALHISYIHTPPRYLYALSHELDFLQNHFCKFLLSPVMYLMRKIDVYAGKNPDILIANSKEVQKRIKNSYNRDSIVIHPPVDLPIKPTQIESKFFIAHSRLVKQKGLDLIIRTCNRYQLKLVVIGSGYYEPYLKKIAGKTIFFTGFITKAQIRYLYKYAKALLYAAKEEDFGIVPVEAQSYGVPVIAYASGGVVETIVDGKTGLFFKNYNEEPMYTAIKIFERTQFSSLACRKNAQKYSRELFSKKFLRLL